MAVKAQAFAYSTGTERPKANAMIKNVAPKKIPMRPPAIDTPSLSPFARMRMPSRANSKASPTKLDAVLILSNRLWVSIFAAFLPFRHFRAATRVKTQTACRCDSSHGEFIKRKFRNFESSSSSSSCSSSVHWADSVTAKTDVLQLICSVSLVAKRDFRTLAKDEGDDEEESKKSTRLSVRLSNLVELRTT